MKFPKDEQDVKALRTWLGEARFARYLSASSGDETAAMALYLWNAKAAQAFYLPIQIWEIGLRNQMNLFLSWKYGGAWPHDEKRAVRQLQGNDRSRLIEARERQGRNRGVSQASTDSIVADLSAGFWVGLLARGYEVPLQWRNNLSRVFPQAPPEWRNKPTGWNAAAAHKSCEEILNLRNRVAHHEPIYHLNLDDLHNRLELVIGAMNSSSFSYLADHCTVPEVLRARPTA